MLLYESFKVIPTTEKQGMLNMNETRDPQFGQNCQVVNNKTKQNTRKYTYKIIPLFVLCS